MKKIQQLREHLIAQISHFQTNPDGFTIRADTGVPICSMGNNLSIEYRYTVQILFLDYADDIDSIMIPLMLWLSTHQSELLVDPVKAKTAITFEIDVIDNSKCDIMIRLPLTERHIAQKNQDGSLNITVPDEPQYETNLPADSFQSSDQNGNLLFEWQSTNDTSLAVHLPFPTKKIKE